jgi:hypothetical protein
MVQSAIKTGLGLASYQVVQEFFSVAFRNFPTPMSFAEAQQYLAMMFRPLLVVGDRVFAGIICRSAEPMREVAEVVARLSDFGCGD